NTSPSEGQSAGTISEKSSVMSSGATWHLGPSGARTDAQLPTAQECEKTKPAPSSDQVMGAEPSSANWSRTRLEPISSAGGDALPGANPSTTSAAPAVKAIESVLVHRGG